MKFWKRLYVVLFFGMCLIPLAAMPFAGEETSTENRTLAAAPSLRTEEGLNVNYLADAGAYFQDHFAFRSALVTSHALLMGKAFGVSAAEGVIQGTDGWLYYKDSLDDFLGRGLLSERSLYNVAHSLAMMQQGLEERGVQFLFAIAPNKNSLYGEQMPYYDSLVITQENNLARLKPLLESEGVRYADLKELFEGEEEILYHMRDSHWNNKGAALAADRMMGELGKEHDSYEQEEYEVRADFTGDLDEMLYPGATVPEDEIYYEKPLTFAYVGEVESNFDPKITTVNPVKSGNLVMYRDSFANALLPFFADAYSQAYFSRTVPYQVSDVDVMGADTVIVERAERFLPNMAQNPPVMECPAVQPQKEPGERTEDGGGGIEMVRQGLFYQISGYVDSRYLEDGSDIYVRVDGGEVREAFPATLERDGAARDGGFVLYLRQEELAAAQCALEVLVGSEEEMDVVFRGLAVDETPVLEAS